MRRYNCIKIIVQTSRDADASAEDDHAAMASRLEVGELVVAHGPAPQGGEVQGPAPPWGVMQVALQGGVMQGPAPPGGVVRLVE